MKNIKNYDIDQYNIVNNSLQSPQKDGHSTCADAVVQKLGEAATSRRQASELMSL